MVGMAAQAENRPGDSVAPTGLSRFFRCVVEDWGGSLRASGQPEQTEPDQPLITVDVPFFFFLFLFIYFFYFFLFRFILYIHIYRLFPA